MLNSFAKEKIGQWLALITLAITGFIILYSLQMFINSFLGAIIIYVVFKPMMKKLSEKYRWNKSLAVLAIILLVLALVLIPMFVTFYLFIPKMTAFFDDSSIITTTIKNFNLKVYAYTGINMFSENNIVKLQEQATVLVSSAIGSTMNVLGEIGVMLLILYYLFINYGKVEAFVLRWLPMRKIYISKFSDELKNQTYSNVLGAPVLAFLQGIVAFIGYWITGLKDPVFWGIMTGIFSFLPFIGSAMIWIPASAYIFSEGNIPGGIGMLLYGIVVISMVDNVFRFVFQKKFADVHPLITIFGVIIGLQLFGVTGLIFGPLLISYFILLLKVYREEYI